MSVNGRIRVHALLHERLDSPENRSGPVTTDILEAFTFEDGTGDAQADLVWSDRRTLAGSADETIDLAGALTDAFGASVSFAEVTAIVIRVRTSGGAVAIGPNSSNGWLGPFADASDRIEIGQGGPPFCIGKAVGWAVTAGTGDLLFVANPDGTSVTYDIAIIGRSA